MEDQSEKMNYSLRPATADDATTIRQIIRKMNLNPLSLHWQHFTLAVDQAGNVIGCGQIKHHADGSSELASIAVLPEWRGKGIARKIITSLLAQHPGSLYLTCRRAMVPMYQKFGFEVIQADGMTPYFHRLSRVVNFFSKLFNTAERMQVMRRN